MNARMRTEMGQDESEIDLNECEHFFVANLNRSEITPSIGSIFEVIQFRLSLISIQVRLEKVVTLI